MRRTVLIGGAAAGVAGCLCGTPYVELEPAVLDLRPPNMYMLIAPTDVGMAVCDPVEDAGNGNIFINTFQRPCDYARSARPFPLPPRLPVAGGMATYYEDGDRWGDPDLDLEGSPAVYYEVLSAHLAEPAAPPDRDGPYVAAEVFGEVRVSCFTEESGCPWDHTGTFAVIVKWPDTSDEAAAPEAHKARPMQ